MFAKAVLALNTGIREFRWHDGGRKPDAFPLLDGAVL